MNRSNVAPVEFPSLWSPRRRLPALLAAAIALTACTTPGPAAPPASAPGASIAPRFGAGSPAPAPVPVPAQAGSAPNAAAAASAVAPAAPLRPDTTAMRPFDDVVRGATRQAGFLSVWRKDERVWLEVPLDLLDKPFLFSVNFSHSVGERGLYASQMGPYWLVSFRRIGAGQMQLLAHNTDFVASKPDMQAALEQSFSKSLLAATAIVSAPHAQRRSVLVDAGFLLSDIPGYATRIETAYRLPYGLDRSNSYFENTRATDDSASVEARLHYAMARLPAPPLMPSPVSIPQPSTLPDPRSLFVGYVYNFSKLPEQPMTPRRSDPRLGHFSELVTDYGTDLKVNPRLHYIARWRLEKTDPKAELSEPKAPIVFWLDKNIPPAYRKAAEDGVLEWNKAFERIGFRNALVVRQQTDKDTWDSMDSRHASIRWFVGRDVSFAIGPHHSDPRTGEIFDADIGMSDAFSRTTRRLVSEELGGRRTPAPAPAVGLHRHGASGELCTHAHDMAQEMDFAFDLLEARGDLEPDSPEAEALVQQVIKGTVMHEVGHALGLKHNFKGSTVVTRQQLRDKAFTEANGLSGSVMDYVPFNMPLIGEAKGTLTNAVLGPYDHWAIEYAYKQIDPADEEAELARIASRSNTDPRLLYSDDEETGGGANDGIDPLANRFDMGDDPLAYYQRQLTLSRELWAREQVRLPKPGDDPRRARRVLLRGFDLLRASTDLVSKFVGGMHTHRDVPSPMARPAYAPVDPARQREALKFITQGVFSADSFRFEPRFLGRLAPDYTEDSREGRISVPGAVLFVQTAALDRLLSVGTAGRLLDLPTYLDAPRRGNVISLAEVYGTVQNAVWSELRSGQEIDRLRRSLQREHLRRVQGLLLRSGTALPQDALSLVRFHAAALQGSLQQAVKSQQLSVETRAHLQDSLSQVTEALRASMLRS